MSADITNARFILEVFEFFLMDSSDSSSSLFFRVWCSCRPIASSIFSRHNNTLVLPMTNLHLQVLAPKPNVAADEVLFGLVGFDCLQVGLSCAIFGDVSRLGLQKYGLLLYLAQLDAKCYLPHFHRQWRYRLIIY